ncbi:MAG: peptide chain release factor N(5)-glutamine methyltransferase [bacterium]|nr:peptide chain release factor N(5)-glutamine methyltransferase [bacterium]
MILTVRVAEASESAYRALSEAGIEDARREAMALAAACMRVERAYLTAHPDALLTPAQKRRLEGWLRRRAAREPLPYITRRVWFYGLELAVGRGALIPRPETELLVELFLEWASSQSHLHTPRLVDAGTGSGAIALACLSRAPQWMGVGIDRSRRALHWARLNRRQLGLDTRLLLIQADWLNSLRPRSVDAILSNPPYVLPDEWDALQPEITRYEPRSALLVPADDPLLPYRRMAHGACRALRSPGLIALESSPRLASAVAEVLRECGFPSPRVRRDYGGTERIVWATR